MSGISHQGDVRPGRVRAVRPRAWSLWTLRPRIVGYVVTVVAAALVLTGLTLVLSPVPVGDLGYLAVLVACCLGYGELSIGVERCGRQYSDGVPHFDLNSVWMFAGILLLHPALNAVLVAVFYLHRWLRVAHHFVHRQVFNVAAAILASLAAAGFLAIFGHYHTFDGMPRDMATAGLLAAAAAIFLVLNSALVSTVVALSIPRPTLRRVTADWSDYGLEAATLALGTLLAWALVDWPVMVTPVVGVTLVLSGKVLIRQLRAAARTDAKTGLLNTAAWYETAREEIDRARPAGSGVGILMLDLDHFKRVNDRYGHLAGDEILVAVADTISRHVRSYDAVGRFGGEEFLALLPDVDEADLVQVAERIRLAIAGLTLPVTGHSGAKLFTGLTASIGIAVFPRHGDALEKLLRAADSALFAAKTAGRNRIRHATGPDAKTVIPTPRPLDPDTLEPLLD